VDAAGVVDAALEAEAAGVGESPRELEAAAVVDAALEAEAAGVGDSP